MTEVWNLDYNAGAPIDPRVRDAMAAVPDDADGNPASPHRLGRKARDVLEGARERIAEVLARTPDEIVFTSGGTEANNLAVASGLARSRATGHDFWFSPLEHASVLEPCLHLVRNGHDNVRQLSVDRTGQVVAPSEPAGFATVVYAHHELGVIQDLSAIRQTIDDGGGVVHSDASQALGRVTLEPVLAYADLVTLSPHKAGGPRGIGVLVVDRNCRVEPVLRGGSHELGRRPGTPVPRLAVGAACAIELAVRETGARARCMQNALDAFLCRLPAACEVLCADARRLLPNTRTVSCYPIEARLLQPALDMAGICVSFGAACSSGAMQPSRSLSAIGVSEEVARACLRISVDSHEIEKKLEDAADLFSQVFARFAAGRETHEQFDKPTSTH